mmetsp:Transcript_61322/g.164976  ORF Transcript_61322/g.164976 Transcript_61322/m.164976 type:complete len:385 (-) Transcript_61322:1163-2317(-)
MRFRRNSCVGAVVFAPVTFEITSANISSTWSSGSRMLGICIASCAKSGVSNFTRMSAAATASRLVMSTRMMLVGSIPALLPPGLTVPRMLLLKEVPALLMVPTTPFVTSVRPNWPKTAGTLTPRRPPNHRKASSRCALLIPFSLNRSQLMVLLRLMMNSSSGKTNSANCTGNASTLPKKAVVISPKHHGLRRTPGVARTTRVFVSSLTYRNRVLRSLKLSESRNTDPEQDWLDSRMEIFSKRAKAPEVDLWWQRNHWYGLCRGRTRRQITKKPPAGNAAKHTMTTTSANSATFCTSVSRMKKAEKDTSAKMQTWLKTSRAFDAGKRQGLKQSVRPTEMAKRHWMTMICQIAFGMLGTSATNKFRSKKTNVNHRVSGLIRENKNE